MSVGGLRPPTSSEGTLVTIASARIHEGVDAQRFVDWQLPVRSVRERRELVPLRAVSEVGLAQPPGEGSWMLYVEDMHDGGRLKVNGTVVADLPVTDADTLVRQPHPSRFKVPAGLLRGGINVIEREWAIHENMLLMPRMAIGEAHRINALYTPRDMTYRVLPGITTVVALMLALIMFSIYLSNRDLKAYLWVAVSALGFCVVGLMFFLSAIPTFLVPYWRLTVYIAGCALTLGTYYFLLDISGVDAPRYRRWSLGLAMVLCGAYFAYHLWTGLTFAPVFSRAFLLLTVCGALLPFLALVRSLMKQFRWRWAVLLLVVVVGVWVNVMDLTALNAGRSVALSGYLVQGFALLWFTSICAFLITDFSRSLAAQRAQAAQMARELAAQREELSRLHALERTAREAQAASLERSRIMQDMHDGLGSQLVSSLVMARAGTLDNQQTCELLRSCIDDLRLAIDSSDGGDDALLVALGNLRFRMQPRLKAAGIVLHWHARTLHPLPLRPQDQLPVLRLVQESLTNALKHARAKNVFVEISRTDVALVIRIEDDGQGFDVEAAKVMASGKGLNSLDKRARVLVARLEIDCSDRGSVVRLEVPLVDSTAGGAS
ncbi:MAG TPA: ATP-binding protein [Hydrogenophaga sp.]